MSREEYEGKWFGSFKSNGTCGDVMFVIQIMGQLVCLEFEIGTL